MMIMKRRQLMVALAGAAAMPALGQQAPDYPSRPIRFIVPSPPGGGTDRMTRLITAHLGETLQWQWVVDNRPGAGGNLGLDAAAKSSPDGYTIAMGESSNLAINQFLYARLPFDPDKDLAPVILIAKVPLVLVVGAGTPYDSVASLVNAARQKSLTFASSGNGTVGHLVAELWKQQLGVALVHVPYRGGGPAIADVASGQVDLHFASVPAALPMIQSGKVRPLAVTSLRRTELLPEVQSLAELGYRDFDNHVFYGAVAPAGTPPSIVSRLNLEMNRVLKMPGMMDSLKALSADRKSTGGTPADFAAFLRAERAKWEVAVKASGAKVD